MHVTLYDQDLSGVISTWSKFQVKSTTGSWDLQLLKTGILWTAPLYVFYRPEAKNCQESKCLTYQYKILTKFGLYLPSQSMGKLFKDLFSFWSVKYTPNRWPKWNRCLMPNFLNISVANFKSPELVVLEISTRSI